MIQYLSGDADIGSKKSRQAKKAKRKKKRAARKQKHATKKAARKQKHATRKAERKAGTRPKRIAKIALAPSRGAFLSAVRLNALKLATKLVRVYKSPGGEKKLREFWIKFGGKDFNKLKSTIAKGAKQQLSGDEMGVALETLLATAAPIIIAIVPIIKAFKAQGDDQEASDFDEGIQAAKEELASNPEFEKSIADMGETDDVAVLDETGGGDDGEDTTTGSFFSLGGVLLKLPLILMLFHTQNIMLSALIGFITTYCIFGLLVYPLYLKNVSFAVKYFYPFKWFGLKTNQHGVKEKESCS